MNWRLIGVTAAVGLTCVSAVAAQAGDAESSAWHWQADLALRAESTQGFSGRDDIERVRSRLRLGGIYQADAWELELQAKAGLGSDHNRDNRANLDNEKSNGIGLDTAVLRGFLGEHWQWAVGKQAWPLATTPLTWDSDLRPAGLALIGAGDQGDFNRWHLRAGSWAGQHLYRDQSRIHALQLGWQWRPGAPLSAELWAGWMHFDDLERATREGLSRSNRRLGDRLLSDYRLLDLQAALSWQPDSVSYQARLNLVRNLGADNLRDGARFSLVRGDRRIPGQWEFAVSYQRIGRDAVAAAFSADDWWFHSAARGVMPWIGYGINATWSLQLSYFRERLDGETNYIHRTLLDLQAVW